MLLTLVALWSLSAVLALGPAAFVFIYMRSKSNKSWPTKVDKSYKPRVSIIIPTFNESRTIQLKLENLSLLKYPEDLKEIILVDSNSSDATVEIARKFSEDEKGARIKILVEKERKGKSKALNYALEHANGEVIVVSDADCFWPPTLLENAVPFLADPTVGAVAGPKMLFEHNSSWITRLERNYLRSANVLRLGESKAGSTVFFEGGFSAFKREAFRMFDPYGTGSDDCGTVVNVIENDFRAMLVPDAKFYSPFPNTYRGKLGIKLRRINQLLRVFMKYLDLLAKGRIKKAKKIVIPNALLYLLSPIAFVFFLILTGFLIANFPYLLFGLVFLLIPGVRFYFYQIIENNLLLFLAMFGVVFGKNFSVWGQPEDRDSISEEELKQLGLV